MSLRILFLLPVYGRPDLPNGAAITSHEYVRGLVAAGHQVDVVTTYMGAGRPRPVDGVQVWPVTHGRRAIQGVRPDLVVLHHGDRKAAQLAAAVGGVPQLLLVHGMAQDRNLRAPALVWFPSEACRAYYAYEGPCLVLAPPIDPVRYRTTPGSLITLNGSTDTKGVNVLGAIAKALPGEQFLMIRTPGRALGPLPSNVQLADRTDPRSVYARTRVLLMPSAVESYGRVGVEAMLSGIPVVAAPLPGIREALGDAAVYVDRDDVAGWVRAVEELMAPEVYAAASQRALRHTAGLDHAGNLAAFEAACRSLTSRPAAVRRRAAEAPSATVVVPRSPDVVAWIHYGVPYRRAGSETMIHTMMRALRDAGRSVLLVCSDMPEAPASWQVDGVPYVSLLEDAAEAQIRAMSPKVVVTHHHYGYRAVTLAREIGSRSVLIIHNDHEQPALAARPDLCVYNTHWIIPSLAVDYPQLGRIPSIVVHPPVIPHEHRVARSGQHVTLVNLNQHKGVETWRRTAKLLPRVPFLGVTGAHGQQHPHPMHPNMRVIPQTTDMRGAVWARTRILLAPSVYESYGMAAVEALASGLPVIAHPTPGLRESLGDAGTFVYRDDVRAWAEAVRRLYAGPEHTEAAARARARSAYLDAQTGREMALWVDEVTGLMAGVTP
ncbi:glycosyltransferase family 4 protein [Streptomyces vinaceus]|uniref:glycosyltransferase family 4 protein n=1 Tax=Streptomyces vinaceus TaxID=1960 RepID=UPI0036CEC59C